jgi:ribosome-associated translation inhibitor RaiA
MESPPEIVFRDLKSTPAVDAAIAAHIEQLEKLYGRITSCRVVVQAPSGHHRSGGHYEVHIHILLPDHREVNVDRSPTSDGRDAELTSAVDDAFKHARRQLEDLVRRAEGEIRQRER